MTVQKAREITHAAIPANLTQRYTYRTESTSQSTALGHAFGSALEARLTARASEIGKPETVLFKDEYCFDDSFEDGARAEIVGEKAPEELGYHVVLEQRGQRTRNITRVFQAETDIAKTLRHPEKELRYQVIPGWRRWQSLNREIHSTCYEASTATRESFVSDGSTYPRTGWNTTFTFPAYTKPGYRFRNVVVFDEEPGPCQAVLAVHNDFLPERKEWKELYSQRGEEAEKKLKKACFNVGKLIRDAGSPEEAMRIAAEQYPALAEQAQALKTASDRFNILNAQLGGSTEQCREEGKIITIHAAPETVQTAEFQEFLRQAAQLATPVPGGAT